MSTVTLQDPQSGALTFLRRAELAQRCKRCGEPMEGEWICAVEGGVGWVHLDHLERELLGLEMTPAFRASREAREQVRGVQPGDRVEATPELLAALLGGEA